MKVLEIILLGTLILSAFSTLCPLDKKFESQIYSDSVSLSAQFNGEHSSAQNLVYNYAYQEAFSFTPNVAIGLNEIQANQSPYLEISINSPRITEEGIYFQAQSSEKSAWKNFKINFLASTRDDIELGSVSIVNPSVNRDNAFELAYPIKGQFDTNGLKVKSYLQGINVQSLDKRHIGIKETSSSVIGQTVYFTFSSVERASIVRALTISLVVFNVFTPGVLYADGIIDQNFVVSRTEISIPKHGINELRTYIVGINSFDTSAAHPISISSAIDETFTLVIGPIDRNQIDFISVSYLILSIVDCGSCSGFPLLFDGLCRKQCPIGSYQRNGRCIPIDCSNGFQLSDNGQCVPICGQYQTYVDKTCVCNEGYYLIGDKCVQCQQSQYFDYKERKCVPFCSFNSYYSNGRCFCNLGFNIINGLCQKCPYGSIYNERTQTCQNICKEREVYSPDGCVCQNGYFNIGGECSRCPYKTVYNPIQKACECEQGYEFVYGECVPVCPSNEHRVDYACVCKDGFNRVQGRCIQCPKHSYYDLEKSICVCKTPFMLMNGECMPACPRNTYLDEQTYKCVPYCEQYLEEYINGKCECTKGYERSRNGTCVHECLFMEYRNSRGDCVCNPGYVKNYGLCQPINCPPGTTWNQSRKDCISFCKALEVYINGRCVCQAGYQNDNRYGDCTPECSDFQVRENGYCKCPPNYKTVDNGICIPDCPPGSYLANGKCQCLSGQCQKYCPFGQQYDPITSNCRCLSPRVWVMGQCTMPNKCGNNQYWCGTHCVCNNGYYKLNGMCTRVPSSSTCPSNSQSNGVNCLCNQGYYPIVPGKCQRCPANTHWNGKICAEGAYACESGYEWSNSLNQCVPIVPLCNPNQYWDGINCRCRQGYFWINSECRTCPYGTFFDGLSCTPGIGKVCDDPYSFWNGFSCVCLPNFFPLVDGRCISCPAGTHWDGTCCKIQNIGIPLTVI